MGSLDNISVALPLQLDDVRIAIEKLLSTKRFVLKCCDVSPAGDGMLGFLGDHTRISVTYELDGVTSNVTLFAKSYPTKNKERAAFIDQHGLFEREAVVYQIFDRFVQTEECKRWHPRCLRVSKNVFLFEDLDMKRYKMCNVREFKDEKHCLVALTSLARFHGATIIYEEKQNDKKYRLQNVYENVLNATAFSYDNWFKACIDTALILAELSVNYGKSTPHYDTVAEKWHDELKRGIALSSPSNVDRNVITHADLWNNNMMYRYDDDGKPTQCMLVDFQAARFAPPASDVISFLYTNLNMEQLNENMDEYLTHYYEELSTTLSENDVDVRHIFTQDEFFEICYTHRLWGLVQSIAIFQFIFMNATDVDDIMNNAESFSELVRGIRSDTLSEMMKSDPVFEKRMMSLIDEFIRLYIIK